MQMIEGGDPAGRLLRPQEARPEFEAWIKGGLEGVGLAMPPAALERAKRDTSAADKRSGDGTADAAGRGEGGAAIAAAAVAKVVAQGPAGQHA
jgi:hypothetical protein